MTSENLQFLNGKAKFLKTQERAEASTWITRLHFGDPCKASHPWALAVCLAIALLGSHDGSRHGGTAIGYVLRTHAPTDIDLLAQVCRGVEEGAAAASGDQVNSLVL